MPVRGGPDGQGARGITGAPASRGAGVADGRYRTVRGGATDLYGRLAPRSDRHLSTPTGRERDLGLVAPPPRT
jgi:hypothetical protein